MKIKLEIDEKYKSPEIHICSDADNLETRQLYKVVHEAFEKNITAYDENESHIIRHSDIVRIFSQNKNVYLMTESKQYRLKERLYEMESILDGEWFVRISNSEIVNVRKIEKMDTSFAGTIKMNLKGGMETFVSRRYLTKIKRALGI